MIPNKSKHFPASTNCFETDVGSRTKLFTVCFKKHFSTPLKWKGGNDLIMTLCSGAPATATMTRVWGVTKERGACRPGNKELPRQREVLSSRLVVQVLTKHFLTIGE